MIQTVNNKRLKVINWDVDIILLLLKIRIGLNILKLLSLLRIVNILAMWKFWILLKLEASLLLFVTLVDLLIQNRKVQMSIVQ